MKLFVGSLPYSTNDQALKDLFSQAGAVVSASVIVDKFSGRSKGFGFVEMSDEDAKKAIEMFNNQPYEGRTLIVNEARPMVPREQRPGGGYGGGRRDFGGGRRDFHGRGGDNRDDRGGRDW